MDAHLTHPNRRRSVSYSPSRIQYLRYPSLSVPTPFKTPIVPNRVPVLETDILIARHDVHTPEIYFYSPDNLGSSPTAGNVPSILVDPIQINRTVGQVDDSQGQVNPRTNPLDQRRDREANLIRFEAKIVSKRLSSETSDLDNDYKRATDSVPHDESKRNLY